MTPATSTALPARSTTHCYDSPVNLSIFVKVLQSLQDLLQDGGNAGLVQHPGLVLTTGDDMLDDVQDRACKSRGLSTDALAKHGGQILVIRQVVIRML